MAMIEINNLTKDYGKGRGIFDINLSVEKVKFSVSLVSTVLVKQQLFEI